MNDIKRKLLENQVKRHNYDYYVLGKPSLPDIEFDALYEKLEKFYPESDVLKNVGNDMKEGFPKAEHLITMGSQEKLKSLKEIEDWTVKKEVQFPISVQWKYDGISIELQYENGQLKSAVTRGNGKIGDEILSNVLKMQNVPKKLEATKNFSGSIRGEIVISFSTFNSKYANKFANPRNLASGIAKNKTGKNCEDLTIICYDAFSSENPFIFNTESEKNVFIISNGFLSFKDIKANSSKELFEIAQKFESQKKTFDYPIDGVVFKQELVSITDFDKLKPDFQRAYKWEDLGKETVLREIEWSRSGTIYTPIAIFDPIELEGTTVTRASLANESLIKDLDLAIKDTIYVTKRNMIIPKIEKVIKRPSNRVIINPLKKCECCGQLLIREDKKLYCSNFKCPGRQERRLSKWLDELNVKGFGNVLRKHLFKYGIREIIDLYDNEKVIASRELTNLRSNFEKSFKSLYSIKEIPLANFMAGFDIDGLGKRIFDNIIEAEFNTLEKILSIPEKTNIEIPNMGEERISSLKAGIEENKEDMLNLVEKLKEFDIKLVEKEQTEQIEETQLLSPIYGKKICVTGKLNKFTRKEIEAFIIKYGGILASSVNKNTDILIANDQNSQSSKMKAAKKFKTKILSEHELENLCITISN